MGERIWWTDMAHDFYSAEGIRELAVKLPDHLEEALSVRYAPIDRKGRVCMFGVGNSAMAGDIMQSYLDEASDENVPMISDGQIPGWIGKDDHAILISYSGESKEILSCYSALMERGCNIHCIVGGGHLLKFAKSDGIDVRLIPHSVPSRAALGYTLGYLADLIQALGVADVADYLQTCIAPLRKYISGMFGCPLVDEVAESMVGKIPAVYATTDMLPIAKRWRADIYQNCGMIAFYGEMPEFDHNEIVGWADKNAHVPDLEMYVLRGKNEPEIVKVIVDSMTETLETFGRKVHTVYISPAEPLLRNICGCIAGDFLTARLKELCILG